MNTDVTAKASHKEWCVQNSAVRLMFFKTLDRQLMHASFLRPWAKLSSGSLLFFYTFCRCHTAELCQAVYYLWTGPPSMQPGFCQAVEQFSVQRKGEKDVKTSSGLLRYTGEDGHLWILKVCSGSELALVSSHILSGLRDMNSDIQLALFASCNSLHHSNFTLKQHLI